MKSDLIKLSEIAEIMVYETDLDGILVFWEDNSKGLKIWDPRKNINQVLIIANSIVKSGIAKIFELKKRQSKELWECTFMWLNENECITMNGDTPEEAIFQACVGCLNAGELK